MPEDASIDIKNATCWPSLSIVVPCFNEFPRLAALHRELILFSSKWNGALQIVLVDDGSTDQGYQKMQELFTHFPHAETELLHYDINRGKGYALQYGVQAAKHAFVLTMDADVATSPMMLFSWFATPANIDPQCIYIGSREHLRSHIKVPGVRKWSGRLFNLFTRLSSGLPYLDTQCGFKWYPAVYAHHLFFNLITLGWAHDIELLWKARSNKWCILEMPVDWDHQTNSKIRLLSDGWKMGLEVLRLRFYFWRLPASKSDD